MLNELQLVNNHDFYYEYVELEVNKLCITSKWKREASIYLGQVIRFLI